MLLASATHRIHYDLIGPVGGEVVCFIHALLAGTPRAAVGYEYLGARAYEEFVAQP